MAAVEENPPACTAEPAACSFVTADRHRRQRVTEQWCAGDDEQDAYAMAADRAADRALAKNYYEKLVSLAGNADTARPDLVAAKQYLASR